MLVLLQEPEKHAEIMVVFYEASSVAGGESLCLAKHNNFRDLLFGLVCHYLLIMHSLKTRCSLIYGCLEHSGHPDAGRKRPPNFVSVAGGNANTEWLVTSSPARL